MKKEQALAAVVLTHLAISLVHGRAHEGAQVPLPFAGTLFVYIVILAGPLVGLGLSRWRPRTGAWIVALTMAGALIFGLVNHFLIDGSDHVANVAAEWRSLFGATAVLLLLSEAAGVAIGMWAGSAARSGVGD
jgi:F0F1-type ATP synthase membrane subunit a